MSKQKKKYLISIELDTIDLVVTATSKKEAKKKAIEKLNRKKPESYIRSDFWTNRRLIDINGEESIF